MHVPPTMPPSESFSTLNWCSYLLFHLTRSQSLGGGLRCLGICWPGFTSFNLLPPSVATILQGGWLPQVAGPARNRNYLDLFFTTGLMHVLTTNESSFLECDHLPVRCTFMLPFHSSMPPTNAMLHFMANCGGLPNLLRNRNCDVFFLASEVQMANDKLYSILHGWQHSITPVQTYWMPTRRTVTTD